MPDLQTPDVRFDGIGVSAPGAEDAARELAQRLNAWSIAHPNRRILQLSVQSSAVGPELKLTAILAYVGAAENGASVATAEAAISLEDLAEVVSEAEEIVADAQEEPSAVSQSLPSLPTAQIRCDARTSRYSS